MMKRGYTARLSARRSAGEQVVGERCCRNIEDRDADGVVNHRGAAPDRFFAGKDFADFGEYFAIRSTDIPRLTLGGLDLLENMILPVSQTPWRSERMDSPCPPSGSMAV